MQYHCKKVFSWHFFFFILFQRMILDECDDLPGNIKKIKSKIHHVESKSNKIDVFVCIQTPESQSERK